MALMLFFPTLTAVMAEHAFAYIDKRIDDNIGLLRGFEDQVSDRGTPPPFLPLFPFDTCGSGFLSLRAV